MSSFQSGTSRIAHSWETAANRTGQGLYPIVRRVRRPLLPLEPAPESKSVTVKPSDGSKGVTPAAQAKDERKDDAEASNS
jgi:hypothetical protein